MTTGPVETAAGPAAISPVAPQPTTATETSAAPQTAASEPQEPAQTPAATSAAEPTDTSAPSASSTDVSAPSSAVSPKKAATPKSAKPQAAKPKTTKPKTTKPKTTKPKATKPKVVVPQPQIVTERLLEKVNAYRRAAGVKELTETTCADESALSHARTQAANHTMGHRTAGQIERACDLLGGENVAFGYATPAAALKGWWNSPAHRSNILDPRYRYMGVAVAYAADGTPYYTQVFYIP